MMDMASRQETIIRFTSLKDVKLPPETAGIQRWQRSSSWEEIPLKDPLLQRAAWAYLQAAVVPPENRRVRFFRRVKEKFSGVFGCLHGVASAVFNALALLPSNPPATEDDVLLPSSSPPNT
ncbi:unnamed protein product [Cuscuta campestris]|uniref:Uncharacterized protein n=1 Tax=Cuscuta campestris TaxID=132261 RepID=A0A484MWP4_9ASTE|nr:unnamed protein product [Cuscuta campestris]